MNFTPGGAFEPNDPIVISETIDGETVIINLATGAYYTLRDSGATIWTGIQQSVTVPDIARMICSRFEVNGEDIEQEICSLIQELLQEGLIRPAARRASQLSPGDVGVVASGQFRPPVLEKFTDLEAMLLLDPIHDVDDEGWPHPLPNRDGRLDV